MVIVFSTPSVSATCSNGACLSANRSTGVCTAFSDQIDWCVYLLATRSTGVSFSDQIDWCVYLLATRSTGVSFSDQIDWCIFQRPDRLVCVSFSSVVPLSWSNARVDFVSVLCSFVCDDFTCFVCVFVCLFILQTSSTNWTSTWSSVGAYCP